MGEGGKQNFYNSAAHTHQVKRGSTGHFDDVGEALDADGHVLLFLDVLHGVRGCEEERGK